MDKKIVGRSRGGFKTEGPLSYQLKMYYTGYLWGCGATLISSKFAITAYHCIVRYPLFQSFLSIKKWSYNCTVCSEFKTGVRFDLGQK